jgi:hypothetical protein
MLGESSKMMESPNGSGARYQRLDKFLAYLFAHYL